MLRQVLQGTLLSFAAVAAVAIAARSAQAQGLYRNGGGELIPQSTANEHGLDRVWVTRINVDRSRGRVANITQHGRTLFVQTTLGGVQAIDAETGYTHWTVFVGKPDYPTQAAGANDEYVGVTNGSTLYVLERPTGRLVAERRLGNAASAGCALGHERVFVPIMNGSIESYVFKGWPPVPEVFRGGIGSTDVAPVFGKNDVFTANSTRFVGALYKLSEQGLHAGFQSHTRGPISAPISYHDGTVYAGSHDGFVYAVREDNGRPRWRFPAGAKVKHQPVVIGDAVYVIPEVGGMYQLSAHNGEQVWWAAGIRRFIAASATKIYAADLAGRTLVLDAKTGSLLDSLPTEQLNFKVVNSQTDRLYLGTDTGMLQCLREQQQVTPLLHQVLGEKKGDKAAKPKTDEPKGEMPAEGEKPAVPAGNDPFAAPAAKPE
jgi:outer membrane protein assembly factor BamB